VYYRCSKKNKSIKCTQGYIRSEVLDQQISSEIQKVSLPKDWARELLKMAEKDFNNSAQSLTACVKKNGEKIKSINWKLERLLNGYLDQDIEKEIYRIEKSKLLLQKKSLEEEIATLSHKQNNWLEPMKEWIKDAQTLDKIASDTDLFAKKVKAKEIFGSNLFLGEKTVRACALQNANFAGENQWACLRHAHHLASKKPFSSFNVSLYYQIRTYFQNL